MCTHKNYITLHSHTYMSLRACWFFLRQQKSESLIWPDLCALANLRVTRLQWWMPTSRCWSCHFASHNAGADVMSARLQVTKEHVFCFIHVMSRNYFGSDTDISTYNSTYMNVHIIYVHIYISYHDIHDAGNHITTSFGVAAVLWFQKNPATGVWKFRPGKKWHPKPRPLRPRPRTRGRWLCFGQNDWVKSLKIWTHRRWNYHLVRISSKAPHLVWVPFQIRWPSNKSNLGAQQPLKANQL